MTEPPLPSVLSDLEYWVAVHVARGEPVSHLELGPDLVAAAGRPELDAWCEARGLTWHEVGTL